MRDIPCQRKSLNHLIPRSQATSPIPSPISSIRSGDVDVLMPDTDLCAELVGLYFDLIHDQFHSLFHRPSFIEDLRLGKAPKVILFAMMAFSARFVTLSSNINTKS